MMEKKMEVFRGHLTECLAHFEPRIIGRKNMAARLQMAQFCGVSDVTVASWFSKTKTILPGGETLIRLLCYLDSQGYRVSELETVKEGSTIRNFLELIGYGLLSGKEAAEALGYQNTQSLWLVLSGKQASSEEKKLQMRGLWQSRREELRLKKEGRSFPADDQDDVPESPASPQPAIAGRQSALSLQMRALSERLSENEFGPFSSEEVTAIWELTGHLCALSAKLAGEHLGKRSVP
ncbi:MAG: hypothetical protein NTY66_02830 [Candidatus Vogelbacteria bacterium]|nr:hypothetical protein [Candidatus Vogelbacteria bacterium]